MCFVTGGLFYVLQRWLPLGHDGKILHQYLRLF